MAFRLLLVSVSVPATGPPPIFRSVADRQLTGRPREANVPGEVDEEEGGDRAACLGLLLSSVKFELMLGLLPVDGISSERVAFPSFAKVTVKGLSGLVVPTAVSAKFSVGGSAKSTLTRELPKQICDVHHSAAVNSYPPRS